MNRLPIDTTFLSSVIYEGFLRYLCKGDLCQAFNEVLANIGENEFFPLHKKNDPGGFMKIMGVFKGNIFDREILSRILNICKEASIDNSVLNIEIRHGLIKVGEPDIKLKDDLYTAPQIFKIDRYTGLTDLSAGRTFKQLTLKMSRNAYLLSLLGFYSSYIARGPRIPGERKSPPYYFIFLQPDIVINLFHTQDYNKIQKLFIIKDVVCRELREALSRSTYLDAWALEMIMNISIYKKMLEREVDLISLNIFKIFFENRTYKIYEIYPVTIFNQMSFIEILGQYYGDPVKILDKLHRIFRRILYRFSNPTNPEYNYLVRAFKALYIFITTGNPDGLFTFSKGIADAYKKIKDEPRLQNIANMYKDILKMI